MERKAKEGRHLKYLIIGDNERIRRILYFQSLLLITWTERRAER